MSYGYDNRRMPIELKIVLWVVGGVLFILGLILAGSLIGDPITKDRYCFEAGGRIVDNVCMPVDGAIKFAHKD